MENDDTLEAALAALAPLPVTARRLFGGYGLYLEGKFLGVIAEGRLYLRTDAESRGAYVERGMAAFQPKSRPRGPKTVDRNFEVPPEVVADDMQLREWALRASQCKR